MTRRAHPEHPEAVGAADVGAHLREAHDRIRAALADASALVEHGMSEMSAARRAKIASAVLECLTIEMVLHEADEDASIAPRLATVARSLDGVIERVEEHGHIDALVRDLADDWRRICASGAMPDHPLHHRARLARLRRMLEVHLATEEREVFPRIAALPERERSSILREMAERRASHRAAR